VTRERGTYVSTKGDKGYLDAGEGFFKHWGHPNVKRVDTMEEVVDDLAGARGHIDTFRIVSHAYGQELQLGFLRGLGNDSFSKDDAALQSAQDFRTVLAPLRILDDTTLAEDLGILAADNVTGPLLKTLGVGATPPAPGTPRSLLVRALLEEHFVDAITLDDGKAPRRFPHRNVLDRYHSIGLTTWGRLVEADAAPADRPAIRRAIASLRANIPGVLSGAGRTYQQPQAEVDSMADPILAPGGGGLKPEIERDIQEGGGSGPYLTKLAAVRANVDEKTHIEIRGCNVGEKPEFLDQIRALFGRPGHLPSIEAPDLYEYYFRLSYQTYTRGARSRQVLADTWADAGSGLAESYDDTIRMRKGELTRTVNEPTLEVLAAKYGYDAEKLRLLNPELVKLPALPSGTAVWLVARPPVPAGTNRTFKDFCQNVLGDATLEATIRGYNPGLKRTVWDRASDPAAPELKANDLVWLVPESMTNRKSSNFWERAGANPLPLRKTLASPARQLPDLQADLDAGTGFVGFDRNLSKPVARLDNTQGAGEIGSWLVTQGYAPGATAAKLAAPFKRGFTAAANATYIDFLSPMYPEAAVTDVLFPSDPRYPKHIIRRP
jgi:hypothetical protein